MENYLFELAHLVLRYFHVIAGIAWIGASFYFAWLDNNLQTPPQWKIDKGIKGDLWAVHGGGFYEVAKYQNGPEQMPHTLHWFKWEAYTTWITGILLFSLLYYVGADVYLIDNSKSELSKFAAIGASLGFIGLGYGVYRLLCKSPLVENGKVFIAVVIGLLALWTFGVDQLFSDRAVYIHVGALIGTCMVGNVYHIIMPGQRYMVSEVEAGRIPDSAPGLKAKLCSIHNNYATLPVVFIMLSNHFPYTYSHNFGWLILIALFGIGMWVRHYFNLKHQGVNKPSVLISGIAAFFALMLAIAPWPSSTTNAGESAPLQASITDAQAWDIINKHCTGCHSETPTSELFQTAPLGFKLDSIEQVKKSQVLVHTRAVITKDMPLANMTKMTDTEREALGSWLAALKKEQ
ncbi:urate hydroxylase PuuD [Pseudoalteromonas arctica]|uniref:urate hydroxylase PuuD n=1 Tax=Pseudoalteromonas arctica TaxID=394751 RepID=UPI001C9BE506|nr:urate hydroxylase PuuD [Pseudoalteromonas arctica]MBZ2191330.1 urate hydroxylase PuuD [Pseudoalteromonas arctica]